MHNLPCRDLIFREAGVDHASEAAFETASRGFLRPKADFGVAAFASCHLVKFRSPYFTLEVHALQGNADDLSELGALRNEDGIKVAV